MAAAKHTARLPETAAAPNRNDQLVELCDHCAAAQRLAEAQGEKLLVYLLSMAIQEGQTALRRHIASEAGVSDPNPKSPA